MNNQKNSNKLFRAGFALPSVMIASLVLISVLLVSVTGMSTLRVALKNQYYGQLAQLAAEAGVEYAKSCLKLNNGVASWSGSTLKVNTDCRGNELTDCPPSSSNSSCYVVNNGKIQSYFTVSSPAINKDGKAGAITSNGYTNLSSGVTGQPWKTISRTASQLKYTIPLPTISTTGTAQYRADDNYYYYVFTSGTPTFTVTGGTLVADVLVVGGGGSGGVGAIGSNAGGGGGGGAVTYSANQSLTSGTYTATVGAGGASQTLASTAGNNGSLSSFIGGSVSVSAAGGGGGGATSNTSTALAAGKNGSSGGGGGSSTLAADGSGPAGGTASAGFAGGTGWSSNIVANRSGGGGGGVGSIGTAASAATGGAGGAGISTYTTWGANTGGLIGALVSSTYYLGAGGGGGTLGSTPGSSTTGGTAGTAGNTTATASTAAANNSGAGSGGTNGGASGAGGSGVVAVRFARNAISNKVVPMGLSSSNLVLFLDAGNPASYPGTGGTWYDLSGNNNNATLFGSPVYTSSNGGILTFSSASNQYASVNHAANIAMTGTTDMTLIAFIKLNNLGPNQILAKSTNNIPQPYDFYVNNTGNVVFRIGNGTNSDTSTSSATLTAGTWAAVAARFISSTNAMQQNTLRYITSPAGYSFSASSTITAVTTRTDGAQALLIGKNNSGSVQLDADVGMIAVYNTSLSFAQMTEVVNTFRNRYNI